MEEDVKKEESQETDQAPEKPLDKMTAPELREIAKEIPGVTGVHAMKKADLLVIIKEARGIEDKKPAKKRKKKADKPTASVTDLKEKILQLRKEKEAAREGKDRHKVDILRRRIKRLKRQTRKVAQA